MRKALMVFVAALFLVACAKQEVKRDSEDSMLAREAFALAEDMRAAYVKKDFEGLKQYATDEGYRSIGRQFRDFESVDLAFSPKWVDIESDRVILNVAWKGTWTIRGRERKDRGMAVFELTGKPLKLNAVVRSSPFRTPE